MRLFSMLRRDVHELVSGRVVHEKYTLFAVFSQQMSMRICANVPVQVRGLSS